MDAQLKKAIDELGGAVEEFQALNTRVEGLEKAGKSTADVESQLAKANERIDELSRTKASLDGKLDDVEKAKASIAELQTGNDELRAELEELAKRSVAGLASGDSPETAEHAMAFNRFMRSGRTDDLAELQLKALSVGVESDGGYAVPELVDTNIIELERRVNVMRQVSAQITVSTPDYKKLVNRGGAAGGWVGETDQRPETATPTLAQLDAKMGELYANPASTQQALDDTFFDVEAWLASEVAITFSEMENTAFTTGDGVNKPAGLFAAPRTADTDDARAFGTFEETATAAAGVFTGDELIDAVYRLRAGYRAGARWMMQGLTIAKSRKLKDNDGQYLWRPGLEEGQPDRLLGYGIVENEDMPTGVAAGTVPIAFGDYGRAYLVVDRIGTRVLRDPYTHKPFVHFYTTKRVGGMPIDTNAVKFLAFA